MSGSHAITAEELKKLGEWFRQARTAGELPSLPFDLHPAGAGGPPGGVEARVTDPERFYESIEGDLMAEQSGTKRTPYRLVRDLSRLRTIITEGAGVGHPLPIRGAPWVQDQIHMAYRARGGVFGGNPSLSDNQRRKAA